MLSISINNFAFLVLQRNTEARSRNYCCRGKARSVKYYFCTYVLVIGHSNRMFSAEHYIVICGLSVSTMFVYNNS
jgi:hypothetical protein